MSRLSPPHSALGGIEMVAAAGASLVSQQVAPSPLGNSGWREGAAQHWMEAAGAQFPALQMGRSDFIAP